MQTSSVNNRMLHAENQTHSISIQFPNLASTFLKLILGCEPQNMGVSSSKAIQTSKQMQMYKSTRMQAKQMKGAVCSCTCAYKLLLYYTRARVCVCARACVRLMTVNVCLCLHRRACVPVSDECAHVCTLGKTHTHTQKQKNKNPKNHK